MQITQFKLQIIVVVTITHITVDLAPSAANYLTKTSELRAVAGSFDPTVSFRYFTYIYVPGLELTSGKLHCSLVGLADLRCLLEVDKVMEVLFT